MELTPITEILLIEEGGCFYAYPCASREEADQRLFDYVNDNWNIHEDDDEDGIAWSSDEMVPVPEDPQEAINMYADWNELYYHYLDAQMPDGGFQRG